MLAAIPLGRFGEPDRCACGGEQRSARPCREPHRLASV